jgi:hemerythrin superfamily protein
MIKKTSKRTSRQPDAVKMLKADHRMIKKLFDQFNTALGDEKTHLANRLFNELTIHSTLEKELFYPAVRSKLKPAYVLESSAEQNSLVMSGAGDEDTQDLEAEGIGGIKLQANEEEDNEDVIAQAYEDHQRVEEFIERLKSLDPRGSDYKKLFIQLEDTVLEHIAGEEDLILPVAVSQLDVQTLAITMQQRRDNLSPSRAA